MNVLRFDVEEVSSQDNEVCSFTHLDRADAVFGAQLVGAVDGVCAQCIRQRYTLALDERLIVGVPRALARDGRFDLDQWRHLVDTHSGQVGTVCHDGA